MDEKKVGSVERVRLALEAKGANSEVEHYDQSTRTAAYAAAALGEKIGRADADFVRERTGFAIGGVAPVGHTGEAVRYIDADLLEFETVWAAAGAPNAVFRTSPGDLVRLSDGEEIEVR